MKKIISVFVCIIVLFFSGCITQQRYEKKYLGKKMPRQARTVFYDFGTHAFIWKSHNLVYDYVVDNDSMTISIKGSIEYNKTVAESKFKHETMLLKYENLIIIFLFGDRDRNVIAVETRDLQIGGSIIDPVYFEVTLPYEYDYKHLTTFYNYYAKGT